MAKIVLKKGQFPEIEDVGKVADSIGVSCYIVGGFVRDLLLGKENDDFDFVVEGSGIELATKVSEAYGGKLSVYDSYGTASVKIGDSKLEFVGCRKEFYHRGSRNPIVEDGTLLDDLSRRDFTINAMAVCINGNRYGELIDMFGGEEDLNKRIVRCVGDANERFNEDPLRILRGIRMAGKICGSIDSGTLVAMRSNAKRFNIIVIERRTEEISKMIKGPNPGICFQYFYDLGLDSFVLPSISSSWENTKPFRECNRESKVNFFLSFPDGVPIESAGWAALFYNVIPYERASKCMKLSKKMANEILSLVMLYSLYDLVYDSGPGTGCFEANWRRVLNHIYKEFPEYDMVVLFKLAWFSIKYLIPPFYTKFDDEKHDDLVSLFCELDNPIWRSNHGVVLHTNGDDVMRIFDIKPGHVVKEILDLVEYELLSGRIPDSPSAVNMYLQYVVKPYYESHDHSLYGLKM